VIDVAVALTDGSYHTVDSSEMAFRAAGRIAMAAALPECEPVLLEPIWRTEVFAPSDNVSRVTQILTARRGQILGFDARLGWPGWDRVEACLPKAELDDLILELRSATQGAATYEAEFDHYAELTGRLADKVTGGAPVAEGAK
jgi:elongation factor G